MNRFPSKLDLDRNFLDDDEETFYGAGEEEGEGGGAAVPERVPRAVHLRPGGGVHVVGRGRVCGGG